MPAHAPFEPSEDQLQFIEKCLQSGVTQAWIAAHLKVSVTTVSRVVRTHFELRRRAEPKKGVR